MDLGERYQNTAVIGAAGKMGSGIALLLTQEIVRRKLASENRAATYKLTLMDVDPNALNGLKRYLRAQIKGYAEKNMVALRGLYADRADLVDNGDIIQAFIDEALDLPTYTTDLNSLAGAHLVFEAILENIDLKLKVYKQLTEISPPDAYYFTNTSSIPIGLLDQEAKLGGRIIGYHFYNPPAVQRLLELITSKDTQPDLVEMGKRIAADLGKKVIPANDVAGFIGNGHFIRDGLHGIAEMEKLAAEHGPAAALYMVNRVSQDWLVRPMGIFQLIDYVGIDVFQCILGVMNRFLDGEKLHSPLIDQLMERGVRGGQRADGSQKDGFFKYERGISAVYDLKRGEYAPLVPAWTAELDEKLGPLPDGCAPWKVMVKDAAKADKLAAHFAKMKAMDTPGCRLATRHLARSKEIGLQLVNSGVAASAEDVNGVLLNGFFHLYGPINDYI